MNKMKVKEKAYSSRLCLESMKDIVSQNINVENGWVVLESADALSSITVRRNVVTDVNYEIERMYLSLGIESFGYDKVKEVLKVNLYLLQMEEEELHENGGCFPLLLNFDKDESLIQHNYMNETISGRGVIVHLQMKVNELEGLGNFHTMDMQKSSIHRHGSTKFSINEKQLLLTAAKAEAKNRSNSSEARYSKLAKYCFWHEQTGAVMEIRSPMMPILHWTKTGDFKFDCRPPSSLSLALASESIPTAECPSSCKHSVHDSSIDCGSSSRRELAKAKVQSSKTTSFFLDSDTSDDDGMQDHYEEDSFIVSGDVDSSESEDEKGPEPEKEGNDISEFCDICNEGREEGSSNLKCEYESEGECLDHDIGIGNANDNNVQQSQSSDEDEESIKQHHSKRLRKNPLLFLESDSDSDSEDDK